MALEPCTECGAQVSDKAATCPYCGAPVTKPAVVIPAKATAKPSEMFGALVFVIFLGWLGVHFLFSDSSEQPAKKTAKAEPAKAVPNEKVLEDKASREKEKCDANPLACAGEKGFVEASVKCPRIVEKLAKYSVRWTDGMLEPKFSRYRWTDETKERVTYIGDKAEFQNGYGAYTAMIYECDMSADGKTVLDVRANPGRI
jgi:hypothetical protein